MSKEKKEIEQLLNAAREEKIAEEEILKESIQQKNKYISELEEKNKQLNKQLLYLQAEFDNYRKRMEKEKQTKYLQGKINVIEKIISLYEMFNYALQSIENFNKQNNENEKNLIQIFDGIKLLYKEFENFLAKEGVRKIDCLNKKFDYLYHEVVEYEEDENKENDTIIEIVSDGYVINYLNEEYVLRPAKVKVIKNKPKEEKNIETNNRNDASNKKEEGN